VAQRAAQVVSGSCSVWDLLMDFESDHPDRDEAAAVGRLASLARELRGDLKLLRRMLAHPRTRPLTQERWQALDTRRGAIAGAVLSLDLRDTFVDRLLLFLLAEARRVESALQDLGALERRLNLPGGALKGTEMLADRTLRRLLLQTCRDRRERVHLLALVKNWKRRIRSAARRTEISPRDLLALAEEIRAGARQADTARQRLVEANQRLVIGIARRYPVHGLEFLDLVQEGNLGLMRAADRFNPDLGFRFGTYATWWVRQSIGRLLAEQGGSIRIPPHVQESLHKLNRLSRRLVLQTGRQPTLEELAARLGKSPQRVEEILSAGVRPVSADAPIHSGEDASSLLEFLPDPHAQPEEEADRRVRQAVLDEAMAALNPREREIVTLRFQDGLTLQEVGERFGITRERTRQLQEQAIRKLRKRIKADLLRRLTRDGAREEATR
jgi:RNA polymerase primary sigma factor